MPEISVIVPVYNVERYLGECIDSILSQTFTNFELILVDDGSTDCSPEICDEYKRKDSRVKVIHKQNQGVSSARNDGLDAAVGTYVAFIDSDDYISKNYLSVLLDSIKKDDFDFVCASKVNVYKNYHAIDEGYEFDFDLTGEIDPVYNKLAYFTSVWMKLFRRDIIMNHTIRFNPAIKYAEDTAFVYQYLFYCEKIKRIPEAIYFYRVYDGSASRKFQKGLTDGLVFRQIHFESFINKLSFSKNVNGIITEGFAYNGFRLLLNNILYADKKEAINEIENAYKAFGKDIRHLSERICRGENISYGGIPDSFHQEIMFLAKTSRPDRIYRYIVFNAQKAKMIRNIKAVIKKYVFGL